MQRGMGYIPDHFDVRDKYRKNFDSVIANITEKSVDLRDMCSPVKDQGQIGCCVAASIVSMVEALDKKDDGNYDYLSWLFLYYNARERTRTEHMDAGASIREAIKSLRSDGCCKEDEWGFNPENVVVKPLSSAYDDAKDYKLLSYYRVCTVPEMLECIQQEYPFVCGFKIYESFNHPDKGMIKIPEENERFLGGHAMTCVGYEVKEEACFIFKNSWSREWGDEGYCYIPFRYMEHYGADSWTVRRSTWFD